MKFWVLRDRDTPGTAADRGCHLDKLPPINLKPSSAVCPKCGSPLEAAYWVAPHRARLSRSRCGDLIFGVGFELVISSRAWESLAADGITGFVFSAPLETRPAADGSYVVTRPGVTVTRLDEQRSHVVWRRPPTCDVCRLGVRQSVGPIVVDDTTWGGQDIFVASGLYGLKLVSQRFVDSVERHALTEFVFISAEDYSEKE